MKDFLNKVKLGKLTYLGIALKQIITAPRVSLTLALDDQDPIHLDQFLFVATMIHRYEGGGFMFCPSADAYDNIFNLCVLGNMPIYKILLCLPTAFKGKHFKYRDVNPYEAKEIIIETSKPLWVHTDGEVKRKATKIKITNEKEFIKFIC